MLDAQTPMPPAALVVGDEQLVELYATRDVYVSLSARESLGMALVDALAAGVRVVAPHIPAHHEVYARVARAGL